MNHHEFAEKIRKAMGDKIPAAAREKFGSFIREEATEITLRYEWIIHSGFYQWVLDCDEVDFGEGAETIQVWIL